jgi:2-keto-myo-inositol isomerase
MSSIQYCLNSSTIRPAPLMEKIRIAGATGYKAIELWNDDLSAHQEAGGSLQEVKSALGDDYGELLQLGRQIGVAPAMEYLGFMKSVYTIEQAWQIATDANDADATLIMDPFHILRGGGSIDSIALVPGDKVAIWHWNDVPASPPVGEQTDADRVLPGDGVGPLREIEALALRQGYSGFVSLELFNPQLWEEDPEKVARTGLEKMQGYFE